MTMTEVINKKNKNSNSERQRKRKQYMQDHVLKKRKERH